MSNDTRQPTVLTELIQEQRTLMEDEIRKRDSRAYYNPMVIIKAKHLIDALQPKLPAEREAMMDFFTLGQASGYNSDWENQEMEIPEDVFDTKYRQE